MALGFGFNKTKVLATAEKFVQQGKLQNAVNEYLKVVKQDPKDLTVLNTIGDLYARLGQSDEAITCFKKVGETYASDGFTVKAIAMFKKLSKLNPNTECTLRLAELYTQQGLYNDARAQYMQVADQLLRAGNLPEAARIFQKMLELDPENAATQSKLADLYLKIGKKEEAKNIFFSAAQSLYMRAALDAADEALARVLSLDPNNAAALQMRGQIALDSGNAASTVEFLERIADLDSRADALQALLRARLMLGNMAEAEPVAHKLLTVHNDPGGITAYAEALMTSGDFEGALRVYDENAERLLAANPTATLHTLNTSINRIKDNPSALEVLLSLYRRAADTTHVAEVMELLAHAYVHGNQLQKARDLYRELAEMEPENALHMQHYRQVVGRLGEDSVMRPLTQEEGEQALMVDELEIATPALQQDYPLEWAEAIKTALTDSELLDSYNLEQKALAPLEGALQIAPDDVRLNHRLASLYARAERYEDAARCCANLRRVFLEAGREEDASHYAEMVAKYRERAGLPPIELPHVAARPAAMSAVHVPAKPVPTVESAVPDYAMEETRPAAKPQAEAVPAARSGREIDLSDEWESMMGTGQRVANPAPVHAAPVQAPVEPAPVEVEQVEVASVEVAPAEIPTFEVAPPASDVPPAPAGTSLSDILDEARFYISQAMWTEAQSAVSRAVAIAPGDAAVIALEAQIRQATQAAAAHPAPAAAETVVAEFVFDAAAVGEAAEAHVEMPVAEVAPPAVTPEFEVPQVAAAAPVREFAGPAAEPEVSVEVPVAAPEAAAPAIAVPVFAPAMATPAVAAHAASSHVLEDIALDLEQSLPQDFGAQPPATPVQAQAAAAAAGANGARMAVAAPAPVTPAVAEPLGQDDISSALSDIFDEFKEGVEEATPEEEDPGTHYNLGVAFKEMALLDEAIGEFQKVCHAIERGHAFAERVQVYTLLASCFVEKGIPEASFKWYQRALATPGVDEDTKTAIHYELGSVYESAGDNKSALQHFLEVYGTNIDYRDVAERIKALRA